MKIEIFDAAGELLCTVEGSFLFNATGFVRQSGTASYAIFSGPEMVGKTSRVPVSAKNQKGTLKLDRIEMAEAESCNIKVRGLFFEPPKFD